MWQVQRKLPTYNDTFVANVLIRRHSHASSFVNPRGAKKHEPEPDRKKVNTLHHN